MGSWDATCGFSNLPIRSGERVVCFIVDEQHFHHPSHEDKTPGTNNFSYSDETGKPVFLPLRGKYNDYGSVENIDNSIASSFLLKHFNHKLVDGQFDVGAWNEHNKKPEAFFTVEDLVDEVERGRLYETTGAISHFYRLHMVHEYIYDKVTTMKEKYKKFALASWKIDRVADSRDAIRFIKIGEKYGDSGPKLLLETRSPKEQRYVDGARKRWDEDRIDMERFFGSSMGSCFSQLYHIETDKYINELLRYSQYMHFMNETRRDFGPKSGAGSQTRAYDYHKVALLAALEQIKRSAREEEDE